MSVTAPAATRVVPGSPEHAVLVRERLVTAAGSPTEALEALDAWVEGEFALQDWDLNVLAALRSVTPANVGTIMGRLIELGA
jgi:hypothetical protein